jgi:hypothetical protein
MKTYIKGIKYCLIFIGIMILQACSEDNSIRNDIVSRTTRGAVLRTLKVNQSTFNYYDLSSKWSVTVEEQDEQNGSLLSEVKIYATHTANGITGKEKYVKSISGTAFVLGVSNLPQAEISASLSETLKALGLASGQYTPSDKIAMRLVLVLKSGITFSTESATTITGGVFYSSPFLYSVQFFCPFTNVSSFNGDYKVTVDAWQDYSVDDIIPVVYNAADGAYAFRVLCSNNAYISNASTAYMLVTVNPVDASVKVTSNVPWNYGGGFVPTITGTGTVGSCTGDINLKLNFSGSLQGQTLSLVKK